MLGCDAVQPDRGVAQADLGVDGLSLGALVDSARAEAERADEEVVSGGDVLIDEQRDEAIDGWHGVGLS